MMIFPKIIPHRKISKFERKKVKRFNQKKVKERIDREKKSRKQIDRNLSGPFICGAT